MEFTGSVVSLSQACLAWRVGAHLPNRPHPGHHAGYPQRPIPNAQTGGPRPPLPPQSALAPTVPLGVPAPRPWKKPRPKHRKGPFRPYKSRQQDRRPTSLAVKWKAALSDPLDNVMESFKKELDIFPSTLAVPAWQDLLSHLAPMKKQLDFD